MDRRGCPGIENMEEGIRIYKRNWKENLESMTPEHSMWQAYNLS
jgi:hypothetical protein